MEPNEVTSAFLLELRRGTLILAVLAKLKEPAYGYSLISALADGGITIEANTLYPLLRRLEGQGLLKSVWNTEAAKPRKYYCTTEFGEEILARLKALWRQTVQSMDHILGE